MAIGIRALASHEPETILDNEIISEWAGTTPDWVQTRTGIRERRYAPRGTPTSALASLAVAALQATHPGALNDVGTLIVATSTPDQPQPATAAILQHQLGLGPVMTFDLNSVCSGFLTGLVVGAALAGRGDPHSDVLLIGADKYSAIVDRADRRTVSLFGDAAGAVVLGQVPDGYGLHASKMLTHGEHRRFVEVLGGGTAHPLDPDAIARGDDRFRMQGREVREYALAQLPKVVHSVLAHAGMQLADVDRWIFHQGNVRMLEHLAGALGIDQRRVPMTAAWCGNTVAASLPVTLAHAHAERPLARGERLMFAVLGGGMTVGAALLTWY